ncbi:methyltransferase domain-containing protein [Pseudomonas sp. NyZ704]|nr:methyltransferase domain-containing protein [Pseudomonas sp. NyZ704]
MDYYIDRAEELFAAYQSVPAEAVHSAWRHLLPSQPGLACDIGAGSGRDARWLANLGWSVTAVEPSEKLRQLGTSHTTAQNCSPGSVAWLDDSLPELKRLRSLDQRFQLILISAVWMHLPPALHERAMRIVSNLLAPGGILVISLRIGEDNEKRFYPVTANELLSLAQARALAPKVHCRQPDLTRPGIEWDCMAFVLPDDGSGSLPLLRHIIVNDNKSASYKLGLLRALIRIAEGAPGMVTKRDEAWVEIPFGLVALYWLKMYMPLVLKHNLIQTPTADHANQKGYGWASSHFYKLHALSPYDLRVGAAFDAETAASLIAALKDICRNIEAMPVKYITYPGQAKQVFECNRVAGKVAKGAWQVNKQTLSDLGTFKVPTYLWQTFSQHACWLEPAILSEWTRLMRSWDMHYDPGIYERALQWNEDRRDTAEVRSRIKAMQLSGRDVSCVWSQKQLRSDRYAVDHCFPWSRWLNNDLWNLLPTVEAINNSKGDKLPSALLLENSKALILRWWEEAYVSDEKFSERFLIEAEAALPLVSQQSDCEEIFVAMQHQRVTLRANQQLAEWSF